MLHRPKKLPDNRIVPSGGFSARAAGRMGPCAVEELLAASGAGDRVGGTRAAQANADGFNKLVAGVTRSVMFTELPEPRVVHVLIRQLVETANG